VLREAATTNASNATNNNMTCLPGNHGVLCAVCDPNHARYGSTKPCEKCSSPGVAWVWAIVAAILIAVVLTLVMVANRKSPTGLLRPIIDLVHRLTVMLMYVSSMVSVCQSGPLCSHQAINT
jgi:hypothetical protein